MPGLRRLQVALISLVLTAWQGGLAQAQRPAPAQRPARSAVRLQFFGAAGGHVTGSMHLVRFGDRRLVVDVGAFQGKGGRERNAEMPEAVVGADTVLLTHAHLDHVGRLPLLVKRGFKGTIYATPATADLAAIILRDSARLQEQDAKRARFRGKPDAEPLYTREDAERAIAMIQTRPLGTSFSPTPGATARFIEAGHLLGAASIELEVADQTGKQERLLFSGDLGRRQGSTLVPSPAPVAGGARAVVMESTYGGRLHPKVDVKAQLQRLVDETSRRGGKLVIPAFAVGRTQELIFLLNQLYREGKLRVPVYVDSPMGVEATDVYRRHAGSLGPHVQAFAGKHGDPFQFPLLGLVRTPEESRAINADPMPSVIISSSGMAEGGRIVHHLKRHLANWRSTIASSGYQAVGTLGRRIQEARRRDTIKVGDLELPLRATIARLEGLSGHGDNDDLLWWADTTARDARDVTLVHGEDESRDALGKQLRDKGYRVVIPGHAGSLDLD